MADLNLLYLGLVIPVANISFFLLLPDVTKRNWPAFFAFLSSCGVSAAGLPAVHALVQWLLRSRLRHFCEDPRYSLTPVLYYYTVNML